MVIAWIVEHRRFNAAVESAEAATKAIAKVDALEDDRNLWQKRAMSWEHSGKLLVDALKAKNVSVEFDSEEETYKFRKMDNASENP